MGLLDKVRGSKKDKTKKDSMTAQKVSKAAVPNAQLEQQFSKMKMDTPLSAQGKLVVNVKNGKFPNMDEGVVTYCMVSFEHSTVPTPGKRGMEPFWDYSASFDVNGFEANIMIHVYKRTAAKIPDTLGVVTIDPNYNSKEATTAWYPLVDQSAKAETGAAIEVTVSFITQKKKICIDDFDLLEVIGIGSFGKVMLVRKKDSGRLYAMKILKKLQIVKRDEVDHTKSERVILANNRNPFLVGLKYSFQSTEKIYLVLDYIRGGELFYHLQNEVRFDEDRAKFYAAQLLLALEHLHHNDVIYRDLKPENILVDYNGYIALTDFGLCKEDIKHDGKTGTFCGTPEYMAPEVLRKEGYGPGVDWWTLGILLYEMIAGIPPYYDENTNQMYHNILHKDLEFPEGVTKNARTLIESLLRRTPSERLGSGARGAEDIKSHPFFANISWVDLLKKKYRAPWKPELADERDTSNFDKEFTQMQAKDTPADGAPISESMQNKFVGFTFTAENEFME